MGASCRVVPKEIVAGKAKGEYGRGWVQFHSLFKAGRKIGSFLNSGTNRMSAGKAKVKRKEGGWFQFHSKLKLEEKLGASCMAVPIEMAAGEVKGKSEEKEEGRFNSIHSLKLEEKLGAF